MSFFENLIVDLYLFNQIDNRGNMYFAKLIYLIEEKLYKKQLIGPNYKMYKFPFGPYNPNIKIDLEKFHKLNLLGLKKIKDTKYSSEDKDLNVYYSIGETKNFLSEIDELIVENAFLFDIIDDILNQFKYMNGEEIKDYIYNLEQTGSLNQKMELYANNFVLLNPNAIQNPKKKLVIDEEWIDTIDIILQPKLQKRLEEALDDLQNNRMFT
jgi:hypothetical protein